MLNTKINQGTSNSAGVEAKTLQIPQANPPNSRDSWKSDDACKQILYAKYFLLQRCFLPQLEKKNIQQPEFAGSQPPNYYSNRPACGLCTVNSPVRSLNLRPLRTPAPSRDTPGWPLDGSCDPRRPPALGDCHPLSARPSLIAPLRAPRSHGQGRHDSPLVCYPAS